MTHLVVGTTGALGGEICRRLIAAGEPVRGLARVTSDPTRQRGDTIPLAAMEGQMRLMQRAPPVR